MADKSKDRQYEIFTRQTPWINDQLKTEVLKSAKKEIYRLAIVLSEKLGDPWVSDICYSAAKKEWPHLQLSYKQVHKWCEEAISLVEDE